MKFISTVSLFLIVIFQLSAQKLDTLKYDRMVGLYDNGQQLIAATKFPGEVDVLFNMRFTPTQPCTLQAVLIAFSVVKFQPFSGNDTLVVLVYDAQENTKPFFINVVKTYKVNLGDKGFPAPNIEEINPLSVSVRDVLNVPLNPPVLISPKRDMIIAVKLITYQRMKVGDGEWGGFSLLMKYQIPDPDFYRYRRYLIAQDLAGTTNNLATSNGNVGIWIRPIVKYDPNIPPTILVNTENIVQPIDLALNQNYPNPFGAATLSSNPSTTIQFFLPSENEFVTIKVYDFLGRKVRTLVQNTLSFGAHQIQFNAQDLPSGIYYYKLTSGNNNLSRRMILMR